MPCFYCTSLWYAYTSVLPSPGRINNSGLINKPQKKFLYLPFSAFIPLNKYFLGCGDHAQKGNNFVPDSRGKQGHGESRTRLCLPCVLSAGQVYLAAIGSKAKRGTSSHAGGADLSSFWKCQPKQVLAGWQVNPVQASFCPLSIQFFLITCSKAN